MEKNHFGTVNYSDTIHYRSTQSKNVSHFSTLMLRFLQPYPQVHILFAYHGQESCIPDLQL